jgi:hypothetical protein
MPRKLLCVAITYKSFRSVQPLRNSFALSPIALDRNHRSTTMRKSVVVSSTLTTIRLYPNVNVKAVDTIEASPDLSVFPAPLFWRRCLVISAVREYGRDSQTGPYARNLASAELGHGIPSHVEVMRRDHSLASSLREGIHRPPGPLGFQATKSSVAQISRTNRASPPPLRRSRAGSDLSPGR